MNDRFSAPWHSLSYERFLSERLPGLLAERLPLAGFSVQREDTYHCRVTVEISSRAPVNTVLSAFLATPGFGSGIYEREGLAAGAAGGQRTISFMRTSGGSLRRGIKRWKVEPGQACSS